MGLLSNIFGSDTEGAGGLLSGIGNALSENSNLLLGYGAGGAEGMMRGGLLDDNQREKRKKLALDEKRKAAYADWAKNNKLDPSAAALFSSDPELAQTIVADRLKLREPKDVSFDERLFGALSPEQKQQYVQKKFIGDTASKWEMKNIKNADGSETPVYFNPGTMQTIPVPGYASGPTKAQQQQDLRQQSAGIVVEDIDRALKTINESDTFLGGNYATGGLGNIAKNFAGTSANSVSNLLDTVKANATFDKLQSMRASSPTGAALGAVSDNENKLLGAAIGSLEQSQGKEQLVYNLKRVKKVYGEIIHGKGNVDEEGNLKGAAGGAVPGAAGRTKGGISFQAVP